MKIKSKLFDKENRSEARTDEEDDQIKIRNEIRESLKASFKGQRVFCLPPPHPEITKGIDVFAE